MARRRVLTILVDRITIEDGQIRPPAIGEVIEFALRFWEYSSGETGTDQHDATTTRARLEPSGRPPRRFVLAENPAATDTCGTTRPLAGRTPARRGLNRAVGRTTARTGQVELTGSFHGVTGIDTPRVR
ncbi:hypothetical protein [Gordonia oryzae]|uniref:hypothetical protein n=1 Tax=Gordonia oryzae TaxID=2487349 RepID=UPI001FEBF7DB|nr:hypothetical protein [Gordonia oryzae]